MKDFTEATANGKPIAVGGGVIDIVAGLKTFLKINYPYDAAHEYEDKADPPMPGMCESFAYLREVLASV